MVLPGHVESSEKWELPTVDTPSTKDARGGSLPSCFGPHTVDEWPFRGLLLPRLSHLCAF